MYKCGIPYCISKILIEIFGFLRVDEKEGGKLITTNTNTSARKKRTTTTLKGRLFLYFLFEIIFIITRV
jgi:hypothetical protein